MIASNTILLTAQGWQDLQDELASLLEGRLTVALSKSRGLNYPDSDDIGRNLSLVEARIDELKRLLLVATPVRIEDLCPNTVGVGSCVTVHWEDGEKQHLTIVGPPEVAPKKGHISYESPVGQALLGRTPGDQVFVPIGDGKMRLDVLDVSIGTGGQ